MLKLATTSTLVDDDKFNVRDLQCPRAVCIVMRGMLRWNAGVGVAVAVALFEKTVNTHTDTMKCSSFSTVHTQIRRKVETGVLGPIVE